MPKNYKLDCLYITKYPSLDKNKKKKERKYYSNLSLILLLLLRKGQRAR